MAERRAAPRPPARPLLLLVLLACADAPPKNHDSPSTSSGTTGSTDTAPPSDAPYVRTVRVTLDGQPVADTLVLQGGTSTRSFTDRDGLATVTVDPTVTGDIFVLAAHPEARIDGVEPDPDDNTVLEIPLVRYDTTDNLDYPFNDPGEGEHHSSNSAQCLHCHVTLHGQWSGSPHRSAASNPTVHDLYQGAAFSKIEADCDDTWTLLTEPGSGGVSIEGCKVGPSVREVTGGNGDCADCHAPGIDGALGGRDLLDAQGLAYDNGVHCDVCHKIADVDLDLPPGTAGRLKIVRPSEPSPSPLLGVWAPLTFGPLPDVLNPAMGAVYTPVFHEARLCAGCHEQRITAADPARWPEGLPIHSTYQEWLDGPFSPDTPCQSCHMPPVSDVGNAADLYNFFNDVLVGISAGWERPAGTVRAHSWVGPRTPESGMLQLAAALDVDLTVDQTEVVASVTVQNVGPAHALPTGEPLRRMVLTVQAWCDTTPLSPSGGDAIPAFAGAIETRVGGDWSRWPEAQAGEKLRVIRRDGWRDYAGFGPFGDGTFSAEEKGLPHDEVVGEVEILAMNGELPTLSAPLPAGDVVYRVPALSPAAGGAGFAFARVTRGADGEQDVPAFLAVDLVSDNRLLPRQSFATEHHFPYACEAPRVEATLSYLRFPASLAEARGWDNTPVTMVTSTTTALAPAPR